MRAVAFAAILVTLFAADTVLACVPLRYEREDGRPSEFVAEIEASELVSGARSIAVMRVVSRAAIEADERYLEEYGQVYRYRFETREVLKGFDQGQLDLFGLNYGWLQQRIPGAAFREVDHRPLWWVGSTGFSVMQDRRLLDPVDASSLACFSPLSFVVGRDYLVFRDSEGSLLAPGFTGGRSGGVLRNWRVQRPVVERLHGDDDGWLIEVREAIAEQDAGPATFWDAIFAVIFWSNRND